MKKVITILMICVVMAGCGSSATSDAPTVYNGVGWNTTEKELASLIPGAKKIEKTVDGKTTIQYYVENDANYYLHNRNTVDEIDISYMGEDDGEEWEKIVKDISARYGSPTDTPALEWTTQWETDDTVVVLNDMTDTYGVEGSVWYVTTYYSRERFIEYHEELGF